MATTASAQQKLTIDGFLYSKLAAIGSKSETPRYFLQLPDHGKEVAIESHAKPYHDDPTLHKHLGTKVTMVGEMKGEVLSYNAIRKCDSSGWCRMEH